MTSFVAGLDLARTFYGEAVAPLLSVPHTACLIGEGSEVLGYDTERSTDHQWGPRVQIFVQDDQVDPVRQTVVAGLPAMHRGYPTAWFSLTENRVAHHVEISTVDEWLTKQLRIDPATAPDTATWLTLPQQHLLQLTAGEVFHDDVGTLTRLRRDYRWYPSDVWRWLIASQWHLIGNTAPFLGRTSEIGDVRGARLITDRLCRLIMEMAFLQERHYQPYLKWFGRAFNDLEAATTIGPLIDEALTETPAPEAGSALSRAMIILAERHNALDLARRIAPVIDDFAVNVDDAVRPYPVLNTGEIIEATVQAIADPALRDLPRVGGIDQLTHVDDTLINFSTWPTVLADCYRRLSEDPEGRDDHRKQPQQHEE